MISRHDLRLFAYSARQGIKIARANWMILFGSTITYAVIILLYAGIIRLIPDADLVKFGFTQTQMIWYLGATECFLFMGSSWGFKELQQDIQTEQAQLNLLRPGSDMVVRVGIWVGESLFRAPIMVAWFCLLVFAITGAFVPTLPHFLGLLVSLPLAMFFLAAGAYFVGASCLWFIQAEPAYWIWQKCTFLFGAMLWPMVFYPVWLQVLMWFTPFPAMLAISGEWTLRHEVLHYLLIFGHQMIWFILFVVLLRFYERVVLRRIQAGEGL